MQQISVLGLERIYVEIQCRPMLMIIVQENMVMLLIFSLCSDRLSEIKIMFNLKIKNKIEITKGVCVLMQSC